MTGISKLDEIGFELFELFLVEKLTASAVKEAYGRASRLPEFNDYENPFAFVAIRGQITEVYRDEIEVTIEPDTTMPGWITYTGQLRKWNREMGGTAGDSDEDQYESALTELFWNMVDDFFNDFINLFGWDSDAERYMNARTRFHMASFWDDFNPVKSAQGRNRNALLFADNSICVEPQFSSSNWRIMPDGARYLDRLRADLKPLGSPLNEMFLYSFKNYSEKYIGG